MNTSDAPRPRSHLCAIDELPDGRIEVNGSGAHTPDGREPSLLFESADAFDEFISAGCSFLAERAWLATQAEIAQSPAPSTLTRLYT